MSVREQLIKEISQTPDLLIREVLDFLLFIKSRSNQEIEGKNKSPNSDSPSLLNFIDKINSEAPIEDNLQLPRDLSKDLSKNLDQCKLSEFLHQSPLAEVAEELDLSRDNNMRLAASIYWYQKGEISQEKAAQIAALNRRDFLASLAREQVDVFSVDFDDLQQELARD